MSLPRHLFLFPPILVLSAVLGAQTTSYQWSPPNTGTIAGGNNNTIPFWSKSATYQQVHDAATMGTVLTIKGLGIRPAGTRPVAGRDWDMRITLSQTKVTAFNTSRTFSTNLAGANTTMVFGTPATWQKFSWKSFTKSGTTPAFTIPFAAPYTYIAALGNLCWEWRHKNATVITNMAMDASSGLSQRGSTLGSSGVGCMATGKTARATATMKSVRTQSPAYQHHLEIGLVNAANNANSMLAIGLSSTTASIGWCAPVITPFILAPFTTSSTGSFTLKEGLGQLAGSAPFNLYSQFGFADSGLPGGIGLSNVAGFQTPKVPGSHGISRVWNSTSRRNTNGQELATTGSSTRGYGLSIAWLK